MLRRYQRIGILASTIAYCAVMVAMGPHKHFPNSEIEILAASRMICLAGVLAFCSPAIRPFHLSNKVAGAFGAAVVSALLILSDAVLLTAALLGGLDDSRWSGWIGFPFMLGFYGAFAIIPLGFSAALVGTRFARPLWRNSRTSENLMWWQRKDD